MSAWIRRFAPLIALFWLALAVVTNVFVPQLETVAEAHNVSMSAQDAPSMQAAKRIGKVFDEFDSDSSAMIVLEGDEPLGAQAHHAPGAASARVRFAQSQDISCAKLDRLHRWGRHMRKRNANYIKPGIFIPPVSAPSLSALSSVALFIAS